MFKKKIDLNPVHTVFTPALDSNRIDTLGFDFSSTEQNAGRVLSRAAAAGQCQLMGVSLDTGPVFLVQSSAPLVPPSGDLTRLEAVSFLVMCATF